MFLPFSGRNPRIHVFVWVKFMNGWAIDGNSTVARLCHHVIIIDLLFKQRIFIRSTDRSFDPQIEAPSTDQSSIRRSKLHPRIELRSADGSFDPQIELQSADGSFDPQIELRSADGSFDPWIELRSTDRASILGSKLAPNNTFFHWIYFLQYKMAATSIIISFTKSKNI